MDTSELIIEFASHVKLPVDVNDVLAFLKQSGVEDEIEFIGVEFDTDIIQGQIKIFYCRPLPYAEPVRHANIYYHREHETDWQRFICCKELLHLLDPENAHTKTSEDIDKLADEIGLPPEMQNPIADGFATNVDRVAEFRAAAILLPLETRKILMPAYQDGKLTISDIARMADIPRKYAGFVMGHTWPDIHDILSRSKK